MKAKQVFQNAKWIILCKIIQSVIQLLIGMLSARYLGPSNYGLINYAASIVAFALPIMKLGLDGVLVYELVADPDHEGQIMGTSLCMNVMSSLICIVGVSVFATFMNLNEKQTILICILYSISVFFAALEMIQYWFQYKLLSKYASTVMLVAYVVVSLYKVFLLATAKSVHWFALSHSVEYGAVGILLLTVYHRCGGQRLSFSWKRARNMLERSRHYILAALMVVILQNTDHIMLTNMMGDAENGIYSAAITSVGVAQFVFVAIIDSFRPLILSVKKENQDEYEHNMARLYCIVFYLALVYSLGFTVFARMIIHILYGKAYMAAVPVLRILVWYCAFSYMGIVRSIWLLAEEKQRYMPGIHLVGALANVTLNLLLIPVWGACGAAFASFLTQFFMNFLLGFFFQPIRKNNQLVLAGIHPLFVKQEIKNLLTQIRRPGRG